MGGGGGTLCRSFSCCGAAAALECVKEFTLRLIDVLRNAIGVGVLATSPLASTNVSESHASDLRSIISVCTPLISSPAPDPTLGRSRFYVLCGTTFSVVPASTYGRVLWPYNEKVIAMNPQIQNAAIFGLLTLTFVRR